jgi:hypothetical protein
MMQLLLLGATAPSVVAGMLRLTVAALQWAGTVIILRAFLVTMANPAPEASWGQLAVDPDVAEALAAVPLFGTSFGLVIFDLYNDVTEAGKSEDSLGLLRARKGQ